MTPDPFDAVTVYRTVAGVVTGKVLTLQMYICAVVPGAKLPRGAPLLSPTKMLSTLIASAELCGATVKGELLVELVPPTVSVEDRENKLCTATLGTVNGSMI